MNGFKIRIHNKLFTEYNYHKIQELAEKDTGEIYEQIITFLSSWKKDVDFININTSGSTGEPKTIRMPKQSMLQSAERTIMFFDLKKDDTALLCLPVKYIAGKMMLVRAMVSGLNLEVVSPSSNPFLKIKSSIDFTAITPHQLRSSYEILKNISVKKIIVGGAPVSAELESLADTLSCDIYETFGMTETCSHIALRKLNGPYKSPWFKILDGIEISSNEDGCLVIKVPGLKEEKIETNDVVEIKNNSHFKWIGRIDHVINSGGIKVFPENIERKIESIIPGKFYIRSTTDNIFHEKPELIMEGKPLSKEKESNLLNAIKKELALYEMPVGIKYVPKISLTGSQKMRRE